MESMKNPMTGGSSRRAAGRITLLLLAALATAAGLTVSAGEAGAAGARAPKTVKATETDFHIALSTRTFTPGKYTFVAINKGQTTHALSISGKGMKTKSTPNFGPGKRSKLTVTFKKGKYDIYCPVPGHKALGMNVNITVRGKAGATTTGDVSPDTGVGGGYRY